MTGILAVAVSLVLLLGAWVWRGGALFSPGDLNNQPGEQVLGGVRTHAETGGQCSACHAAPWSGERMSDRCLACHSELLAKTEDFHAIMLAQGRTGACYDCHSDHSGAQGELTTLNMAHFPHNAVGYSLQAHQILADGIGFACTDCHMTGFAQFEQSICTDCHRGMDPEYMQTHSQTFGADCLACHDGIDRFGENFDHNQAPFPLFGGHAVLLCTDCHQAARSLVDLNNTPQSCVSCHAEDDAHQGRFGQDCAGCHTTEGWDQASFDHALAAFPLTGAHIAVPCEVCHVENLLEDIPMACVSCHAEDDAHQGRFGQDCVGCHTTEGWDQASFDHTLAVFPLTGAHIAVPCENCHLESLFKGTPIACVSCHAEDDAHQGRFGQDCAGCHTTEGWDQASFDHTLAAFPLTGAHIAVPCENCHVESLFKGTPMTCVSCHLEPAYHLGLFDLACETCHTTQAWSPAEFDRLHTFPINHGESGWNACQTCHEENLAAYTCYGCHEHNQPEIASKHREEGIGDFTDCTRCHPTGREDEAESDDD